MLILGYAGHQRHGWKADSKRKLAARLRHSQRYPNVFHAITSFGEDVEDLPLNLFPLDGVGHDSAAGILENGSVIAAAAEERFNRFKHSTSAGGRILPPYEACRYCASAGNRTLADVEHVAFYCDFTDEVLAQRLAAIEPYLSERIKQRVIDGYRAVYDGTVRNEMIAKEVAELFADHKRSATIHFVPHHLAHAASAFYSSGYAESGVLTIDGFGERSSSIFALGTADGLEPKEETMLPGSLGVLYMMLTAYLGFKPLDGEYKVMGLASYGNPKTFAKEFESLLEQSADGSCQTTALLRDDFGAYVEDMLGPARAFGAEVTHREMDIAAALQTQLETAMFDRLSHLKQTYGIERICLAGGVALNVVMTGKVARSGMFKQVYVFPASGDDGASVGAAQYVYHQLMKHPPTGKAVPTMSLGPRYGEQRVLQALAASKDKIDYRRVDAIETAVADALVEGKVVGWFHGRMEFGPRALGNRSILADPRGADMRDVVNQRVKLREEFRPFAPAVLAERADEYFDMSGVNRANFMEFVVPARPLGREKTKAVVHYDGSARVQTVERHINEPFWKLIDAFGQKTEVPVVLNTSFNVRGEPIVCTPEDAIRCFLSTNIDLLALEGYMVSKRAGRVLAEDMAKPKIDD
jgi:carbamoyltransferase